MKKNLRKINEFQIQSMTGFGEAVLKSSETPALQFICKIKSYNHRFLEAKIKFPKSEVFDLDLQIKKIIHSHFQRGAFDVAISIQNANKLNGSTKQSKCIDLEWLTTFSKEYKSKQKQLARLGFKVSKISLESALKFQNIFLNNSNEEANGHQIPDSAYLIKTINEVTELALAKLKADRIREGNALTLHLLNLLNEIKTNLAEIKKNEPIEKLKSVEALKKRIRNTLDHLSFKQNNQPTSTVDFEKKLQEEASIWIEKRDFEEEVIRFETHLDHFSTLLSTAGQGSADSSMGKLLEFKHQELLREINTLGNKAQSVEISSSAVKIKTLIEKMREQIANIE